MMVAIFLKTLRDKRWATLGWFAGVATMAVFAIAFFPSFSENREFEEVLTSLPQQMQGLLGDALSFRQIENYISAQVFDLRLPLLVIIAAIVMAVSITVSEEEDGALTTLQSLPVSRMSVALQKWMALVVILAIISSGAIAGTMLGVFLINHSVGFGAVVVAALQLWLLGVAMMSFVFMLGMGTGIKPLTVAAGSLFAVYNFLIASLATSVADLSTAHKATLYYYYNNPKLIIEAADWLQALILAGVSLGFLAIAIMLYRRRDMRD